MKLIFDSDRYAERNSLEPNQRCADRMIKQTVLPFKPEITKDVIISHTGLIFFGKFAAGSGLLKEGNRRFPETDSVAGYHSNEYMFSPVLAAIIFRKASTRAAGSCF